MPIPSRDQCLSLLEHVRMPVHIRKHSILVADVAVTLGCLLSRTTVRLNLPLLEAGALLHDLGKEASLASGEPHERLGASMLRDMGYATLATIVLEHTTMDPERMEGPINESLLVNYADKRVKHDEIVPIEECFRDLKVRYARTQEHEASFMERLKLYLGLEKRIFGHLTITPDDLGAVSGSLDTCTAIGWEDYEAGQINSSIAGGRKIG